MGKPLYSTSLLFKALDFVFCGDNCSFFHSFKKYKTLVTPLGLSGEKLGEQHVYNLPD